MSDGKVVSFPGAQPSPTGEYCLKCGECGCTSFYALDTGAVECANCHTRPANGWWVQTSVPQRLDEDELPTMVVTTGDGFAKRRTLQRADDPGCVVVVVMQASGVITTWCDKDRIADGPGDWLKEQMGRALGLLTD